MRSCPSQPVHTKWLPSTNLPKSSRWRHSFPRPRARRQRQADRFRAREAGCRRLRPGRPPCRLQCERGWSDELATPRRCSVRLRQEHHPLRRQRSLARRRGRDPRNSGGLSQSEAGHRRPHRRARIGRIQFGAGRSPGARRRGIPVLEGIPGPQFAVVSYGKERPVCTDESESCWQKNRRAHVTGRELTRTSSYTPCRNEPPPEPSSTRRGFFV